VLQAVAPSVDDPPVVIGSRLRCRAIILISILMLVSVASLVAPLEATAAPRGLSAVVLSNSLPGFVASPPGSSNGPINQSNVQNFGAASGEASRLLADGEMTGYLRLWTPQPPDGDGVLITAMQFSDADTLSSVMTGERATALGTGSYRASVAGVPGASGFTLQASGRTEFGVFWAHGDVFFQVAVVTAAGDLTFADAASLAARQNAVSVPGGTTATASTAGAYQLGELAVPVLIVIVVVGLVMLPVQRRKRRMAMGFQATSNPSTGGPVMSSSFSPSAQPSETGWYANESNPYEQKYWDGMTWTSQRRRWTKSGWTEV
jgi:hypothetical protein